MSITRTTTMRAVLQRAYGSADVLRIDRVPRPEIAADEVLIRVHAAGLDRGVWHLMVGQPYGVRLAVGLRRPRNPAVGLDVAGTIVDVGSSVSEFSTGDEVFGTARGSFAEFAAARVDKIVRKPPGLAFEHAAVIPISALTALHGLYDVGHIQSGQRVLVTGAAGGVGSYAVQLAKAAGCDVTGVCSTTKVEFVRSLGADRAIDYTEKDFADGSQTYDLILDIAGNPTLARLRRALTGDGTAVIAGGVSGRLLGVGRQLRAVITSAFIRQRLTFFASSETAADLARLLPYIEQGRVRPCVDSTFPLDRVVDTMRHLESGTVHGKIAIIV